MKALKWNQRVTIFSLPTTARLMYDIIKDLEGGKGRKIVDKKTINFVIR
jgi:hypothetical protein